MIDWVSGFGWRLAATGKLPLAYDCDWPLELGLNTATETANYP
jgi:hypothetical protein